MGVRNGRRVRRALRQSAAWAWAAVVIGSPAAAQDRDAGAAGPELRAVVIDSELRAAVGELSAITADGGVRLGGVLGGERAWAGGGVMGGGAEGGGRGGGEALAVVMLWGEASGSGGGGVWSSSAGRGEAPMRALRARGRMGRTGELVLVDGQRVPGEPAGWGGGGEGTDEGAGAGGEGGGLVWESARFGAGTAALERVSRVVMPGWRGVPLGLAGEQAEDVVVLANGDRLRGFVETINGSAVRIDTGVGAAGGGGVVEVEAGLVAAVALANPSEALTGTVVWLADGTVVRARSATSADGSTVRVEPAGPFGEAATVGAELVRGIGFGVERAWALVGLEREAERGGELGEGWPTGAYVREGPEPGALVLGLEGSVLGASDVVLGGPGRVVWRLPAGAVRVAATVLMESAEAPWGDCEVTVRVDGTAVWSRRVRAGEAHGVDVALPPGAREVEWIVEPGAHGPVRDRVVLRRALVGR